ncbi:MAG: UDP-N-acetylglucosamine pyrophosphorylase, partial [Clostridia bacterium]|nr:UDP-N-acetylglucosamine pyrophosphorylase [Clostridia bacterium]
VQVPHYNYAGDSILGNNSHTGAGTICSNLKSDKSNIVVKGDVDYPTNLRKLGAILGDFSDVGCNCVINPGTVIGKNTRVYPLTSIRGVIPENSIVKSMDNIVELI